MDKVFIKGLEVEGIIGIFQWEREVKQVISVDIEMEFDNKLAAKSDSIEDALNYKKVGKRVTAFVQKSKFKLVESLACLLYTSPSPRDLSTSRMPSSA